jgi:hypothetical protein
MKGIKTGTTVFPAIEVRFLRRLVRDFYKREASPEFTYELWKTVLLNERANIFPYMSRAQIGLNSTVCYEIGMLKPYLEEILSLVPSNSIFYDESQEVLEKIEYFSPIDKSFLAPDSLYHEFV